MSKPEEINKLVADIAHALATSEKIRSEITSLPPGEEAMPFEVQARLLQLTLDYRLNSQDALVALLNLDHHLLYLLGIQPQHSNKTNMERLSFALGSDDLHQILHALSHLVDYLLRIARRYQLQEEQQKNPQMQKQNKSPPLLKHLKALCQQQKIIVSLIVELNTRIELLIKYEALGPVYDHIAAIRGPISRFYQAQLNGLDQGKELYQQINSKQTLEHSLAELMNKADNLLNQMPSLYKPMPHNQLGHFHTERSEQLEQRAAAKRLRPFF